MNLTSISNLAFFVIFSIVSVGVRASVRYQGRFMSYNGLTPQKLYEGGKEGKTRLWFEDDPSVRQINQILKVDENESFTYVSPLDLARLSQDPMDLCEITMADFAREQPPTLSQVLAAEYVRLPSWLLEWVALSQKADLREGPAQQLASLARDLESVSRFLPMGRKIEVADILATRPFKTQPGVDDLALTFLREGGQIEIRSSRQHTNAYPDYLAMKKRLLDLGVIQSSYDGWRRSITLYPATPLYAAGPASLIKQLSVLASHELVHDGLHQARVRSSRIFSRTPRGYKGTLPSSQVLRQSFRTLFWSHGVLLEGRDLGVNTLAGEIEGMYLEIWRSPFGVEARTQLRDFLAALKQKDLSTSELDVSEFPKFEDILMNELKRTNKKITRDQEVLMWQVAQARIYMTERIAHELAGQSFVSAAYGIAPEISQYWSTQIDKNGLDLNIFLDNPTALDRVRALLKRSNSKSP